MNKQIRINANIGKESVVRVNLKQGVDTFNMLSLTVNTNGGDDGSGDGTRDSYQRFASEYGVIIGRVTVNGGVGVPNAKLSVFIPLLETDENRSEITSLYPFKNVTDKGSDGKRYNLLPIMYDDDIHTAVGSFPTAQIVTDNEIYVEIFDKYYKYTTTTNDSGDYMIYGVPVGEQTLHMDVDLTDIGFLSQSPSDFEYHGYSSDLFDNGTPRKFKSNLSLNDCPQVISEDNVLYVYPFWGDSSENEIAITRKDFEIPYTITPTAIYMGCSFTDTEENFISNTCEIGDNCGREENLITDSGTIELMRETPYGGIETVILPGGVIDDNGLWCVHVPMNLNYITTSESGEIVKTTDVNIGIPTRARVRFKMSLDKSFDSASPTQTINYYVPSNCLALAYNEDYELSDDEISLYSYWGSEIPTIDSDTRYDTDEKVRKTLMRDLLWNCVYSVKNYIPRFQTVLGDNNIKSPRGSSYTGLKNLMGLRRIPFNKLHCDLAINNTPIDESRRDYMRLTYDMDEDEVKNFKLKTYSEKYPYIFNAWKLGLESEPIPTYDQIRNDDYNNAFNYTTGNNITYDFYNDWLNGALYFPRVDISNAVYCSCRQNVSQYVTSSLYAEDSCSLDYSELRTPADLSLGGLSLAVKNSDIFQNVTEPTGEHRWANPYEDSHDGINNFIEHSAYRKLNTGFIYADENGENYNYSPIVGYDDNGRTTVGIGFMTDLILLGSTDENNIFGIPHYRNLNLPNTTWKAVPLVSQEIPWYPLLEVQNPSDIPEGEKENYDAIMMGIYEHDYNFDPDRGDVELPDIYVHPDDEYDPNEEWYHKMLSSLNPDNNENGIRYGQFYRLNGAFWGSAEYTPWICSIGSEHEAARKYLFGNQLDSFFGFVAIAQELNGDIYPPRKYFYSKAVGDDDYSVIYDEDPKKTDCGRHCLLGEGLFYGINAFSTFVHTLVTKPKSCINAARICELSVVNENSLSYNTKNSMWVDSDLTGIIGEDQITTTQYRSLFASLNSRPLITDNSGLLPKYKLNYVNVNSFDGLLDGQPLKQQCVVTGWDPREEKEIYHYEITARYHEKHGIEALGYNRFRYGDIISFRMRNGNTYRGINTINSFYFFFGFAESALNKLKKVIK